MPKRLLLFDIDGTLILSGGKGRQAFIRAMSEYTGQSIDFSAKDFAGSTDRQILITLLARNRLNGKYQSSDIDKMLFAYLNYLQENIANGSTVQVLSGVISLLNELSNNENACLGLVTGNLIDGAQIKLGSVNLYHYFPIGGFGSDATDRNLLPPIAIDRAGKHFEQAFTANQVWIIGDTPRDIACAKANNLRSLAVSTGHWDIDQLNEHQPTASLKNLADTEQVLDILST